MWNILVGMLIGMAPGIVAVFFAKPIFNTICAMVTGMTMYTFHGVTSMLGIEAKGVAKAIAELYETKDSDWIGFVEKYISQITGKKVQLTDLTQKTLIVDADDTIRELGRACIGPILSTIAPMKEIKPEDGLKNAEAYLGINLRFQMSAWLLHLIGDMYSFGSLKSLKDLPNAISWSFGLGWLSWLVMGTPFKKAISDPLDLLYNRVYRPNIFSEGQAIDLWQRGRLTASERDLILSYRGWSSDRIPDLIALSTRDYSPTDLQNLYFWGLIESDDLESFFRRAGYDETRVKHKAMLLREERKFKLIQEVVDEAEQCFLDNRIEASTYESYLDGLGYSRSEKELKLGALALRRERTRVLSVAQIKKALDQNLISQETALDMLNKSGYSLEVAEIVLKLA